MSTGAALIGPVTILICHIVLITSVINLKYSLRKTILLWVAPLTFLFVSLYALTYFLPAKTVYSLGYVVSVLSFMAMYFILSQDSLWKKCFIFFSQVNVFFIVFFVGVASSKYLFSGEEMPGLFLRNTFYILFIVVFIIWIRPRYRRFADEISSGWWRIALAAILFTITLTGHCVYPKSIYSHTVADTMLLITVFVLMFLLYFIICSTIYYMSKAAQAKQIELQVRLMAEQIGAEQESAETARHIHHDLRHHNLVIAEYAKKQDMNGLLKYIDLYEADAQKRISRKICENMDVNYILHAYCKKAEQYGIEINVRAAVPKDLPVQGVHLTAILGNAFENAMLSCTRSNAPKSFIDVLIQTKGKKLIIYIKNTCTNRVVFEKGYPKSKTGGIGIRSIMNAAEHYQGEANFSQNEECFIFKILLNLPE